MINFRLANVILNDSPRSDDYPDLYMRRTPAVTAHDGVTTLASPGAVRIDFATYLNAFSNIKWRRYTVVDNVWLHLRARGTMDVELCRIDESDGDPLRTILDVRHIESDELVDLEYEFDAADATLLSFQIVTMGTAELAEAWYYTKVEEDALRTVELAIATTTFKKEDYILKNIRLIEEGLLGCDEPVANHLTLHVSDNGRTLDAEALSHGRVHVHPSDNVGGAGGFTRGMICAMDQEPKATHVLLMDDDVQVLPEAIKRTFNVLSLVNDEYAEALVSGAMMAFERQDVFHEDTGYVQKWGAFTTYKGEYRVNTLKKVVEVECVEPHAHNRYAGWWYCCIPMSVIERVGLPLPLFIRGDDVEYGMRCGGPFITMNGICLWHQVFSNKYRAFFERYQFNRNVLVAQATCGMAPDIDFLDFLKANVQLDFKHFNYEGVELALDALDDYMRGPEWLMSVNPGDLLRKHSAKNDKLVPIDQIDDERVRNANFHPKVLNKMKKKAPMMRKFRSFVQKAYDYGTQNGQRLVPRIAQGNGLAVMSHDGWAYDPNEIRGAGAILFVSSDGREGVLRTRDTARFHELDRRYQKTLKEYESRKEELRAAYAAAKEQMTSIEFWRRYLMMD